MSISPRLTALCLGLCLTWALPTAAQPPTDPAAACPREQFRGKNAKARRQACLEQARQSALLDDRLARERIEALRLELRERCAQDPRRCDSHRAELDENLRGGWRDAQGEGLSSH